ncbi:kinase [Mycena leptocephala]|nr:kinase [Mycena leptocephala]
MTLKAPKLPPNTTAATPVEDNSLMVSNGSNSAPNTASPAINKRNTYHTALSNTLANLDMNQEIKFDLRNEDLKDLHELGQGNGGSVKKVEHIPTGTLMAKKIVLIDAKPAVRKQILRELQIMHDCHSKYIISFWGAFLADPNICMCIEFMDKGSLDGIYKKIGPIEIDVVGKVALAVLGAHVPVRHIKPSNILCNSQGEIKICDFGVSGELINSIADTFVGTSTYMSPERIQGAYTLSNPTSGRSVYRSSSSRWAGSPSPSRFRMTRTSRTSRDTLPCAARLDELARRAGPAAVPEEKQPRDSKGHIVNEPAPRLTPEGRFPEAEMFIDSCLLKDPDDRKTPKDLLKNEWIMYSRTSPIDLEAWASTF